LISTIIFFNESGFSVAKDLFLNKFRLKIIYETGNRSSIKAEYFISGKQKDLFGLLGFDYAQMLLNRSGFTTYQLGNIGI